MMDRRSGQPGTTTISASGMTFTGASVSAYTTFMYSPDLKVIFDIGSVVEEMLPIEHVFITHAHQDHLLGLSRYVALRRLQRMSTPTVVLPEVIRERVEALLGLWCDLESEGARRTGSAALVGVSGGEEMRIRGNLLVRVFPVAHSLPAVGYTVIERKRKLREEFLGMQGSELVELKRDGVEITRAEDRHLVTYFGDSLPSTLDEYPDLDKPEVAIVECTFLAPEHLDLAEARGHLHIQHLIERLDRFGDAEIILMHFSRRYSRHDVESLVRSQWPAGQLDRIHLLV
jgi:ribonuclease Z